MWPGPPCTCRAGTVNLLGYSAADGLTGFKLALELAPALTVVDIGLLGIDSDEVASRFRADAILRLARASASAARRVNGLDEREPVEVGIPGVDGADAV